MKTDRATWLATERRTREVSDVETKTGHWWLIVDRSNHELEIGAQLTGRPGSANAIWAESCQRELARRSSAVELTANELGALSDLASDELDTIASMEV